jgi:monoamine oxidase
MAAAGALKTVVIGGGAAGISAARLLHDAGQEVLLVEAANRLGGRAHTVPLAFGERVYPLDYGCGWLHSATRNPWVAIGEQAGFSIDRSNPGWGEQWLDLGFSRQEQDAFGEVWDRWEAAARAALDGPDRALGDFIARGDPGRPMLEAISGYANGAGLDHVSLHDWVAYEDASGEQNWSVREGYGALVVSHAEGIPVALATTVTGVDHRGTRLKVHTASGTIEADRVVVTIPASVLRTIRFDPPLPAKQDAAAALPLGLADKVFLGVNDPPWPAQAHLIGNPHSACTASYRLSPFGWPIIEAFFGGDCAERQETAADASALAIDELVALLGSDWRRRLHPLAATRWRQEPNIHGSYSHAAIGRAGARAILAEPVDGRLFFAGEACSIRDFSTAHGARQSGVDAAEAILGVHEDG